MAKQKTTAKRAGAKRAKAPAARAPKRGGALRAKPAKPSAKRPVKKTAPQAQPLARKAPLKQASTVLPVSPKPVAATKPAVTPVPAPGARPNPLVPQRVAVAPVVRPAPQPAPPRPVARTETSLPPAPPRRSEKSPSEMAVYAGMTEADLLQMPTDDYMNDRQLAYFREMLITMKQQLLENADVTSEHLRENDIVPDPADRATIEEEHTLELRTRDRERKLMRKIDESIARISDGSYGWCEETGEAIGLQRLLARPTATLSVEAQARRELKQKLYGE
jgi:RNA polymerase-binding transcription factor